MSKAAMMAFVGQRLRAMLTFPDGWGPPEAVELQVLLLLEVALVARGAPAPEVEGLQERYDRFLAREVGGPPTSLAARLGLDQTANEAFVQKLRRFWSEESQSWFPMLRHTGQYLRPVYDCDGAEHYAGAA